VVPLTHPHDACQTGPPSRRAFCCSCPRRRPFASWFQVCSVPRAGTSSADGGKRANILGRESPILVEIAGACGGQADNVAHLFDQVRASQPRFKHVEHGEMDPSTDVQARRRKNVPSPWPALFQRLFPACGGATELTRSRGSGNPTVGSAV
jgi:hypothetical protein